MSKLRRVDRREILLREVQKNVKQATSLHLKQKHFLLEREPMMDDEIEEIFPTAPKKRKRHNARLAAREEKQKETEFSRREITVLKERVGGATMVEAGKAAGFQGSDASIASSASKAIARIKEKTSNNHKLQEFLNLKGAGLDAVAQVFADGLTADQPIRSKETITVGEGDAAKKVTVDCIKMYPDHRARLQAATTVTEIHQALPDKKIITETHTYEQKIALVAEIKADPEVAMEAIRQALANKRERDE